MSIKLVSFLKQSSQVFQRTSLLGVKQTNLPIKCQIGWKRRQKKVFSILHKQNELLCIKVCIKQTNKKDSSRFSCVMHVKVWRGFKRTYPLTVGVTQDRVKAENVVTGIGVEQVIFQNWVEARRWANHLVTEKASVVFSKLLAKWLLSLCFCSGKDLHAVRQSFSMVISLPIHNKWVFITKLLSSQFLRHQPRLHTNRPIRCIVSFVMRDQLQLFDITIAWNKFRNQNQGPVWICPLEKWTSQQIPSLALKIRV